MSVIVINGLSWGDEAKGRVCDYLTQDAEVCVRYAGSCNSGHSIFVDGKKTVLSHIPAGILNEDVICILAHGMVIDLISLSNEIKDLEKAGVSLDGRLFISNKAHIVLDEHKTKEQTSGVGKKIGTTGKGIGPAYEAKVSRLGVRLQDLLNDNSLIEKHFLRAIDVGQVLRQLKPYVTDTVYLINSMIDQGLNVVFEGNQGVLLDVDYGTYPYVTSSNTVAGAVCTGAGISPLKIDQIIGLTKAYTTRVGEGPFPTEVTDEMGEHLAKVGKEFGAVTGRPRKVGWLDLPLLKYAIMVNGCQMLALTKLDVLSGLKEIKICVSYNDMDIVPYDLATAEPQYETFPGWEEDLSKIRTWDELPENAKSYIKFIEEETEVPIGLISVGPDREDMIDLMESAVKKIMENKMAPLIGAIKNGVKDAFENNSNVSDISNMFNSFKEKLKEANEKLEKMRK